MKFTGNAGFTHGQSDKIGVLITNLGTPQAPTKAALKPYLKEFLSDPRVVEVPRLIWWFILNGVILNIRPKRSAEAYASVWSEQGSPLMVHTKAQAEALAKRCATEFGDNVVVEFAMRYGEPSVSGTIDRMLSLDLPVTLAFSLAAIFLPRWGGHSALKGWLLLMGYFGFLLMTQI